MLEEIFGILEESFLLLHKDSREVFMLLSLHMPQPYMTAEAAFNWLALACDREVEDIKSAVSLMIARLPFVILSVCCISDISLDLARISNSKTFYATTKILQIVELKRKGFVESMWEYSDGLYIHDLHKEFAENKADGREKWISVKESRHIPIGLQEALSSDRHRFSAMKFDNCHFQVSGYVDDEVFRNVLVLHLQDMQQLKFLNLSPMKIVRSITIVGCEGIQEIRGLETLTSLVYFLVKGCSPNVRFSGIEGLLALEYLQVDARHRGSTTESSPLSWMSFPPLQSGSIIKDHIENGVKRLDLSCCAKLRAIMLAGCDCKNLSEISLFNSNLVVLETTVCSTLTSGSLPRLFGIDINLTEIRLVELQNLKELPALTGFTALRILHLKGMRSLKELPALTGFTALRRLELEGMHSLKELPALTGITALEELRLDGMHSLKELPALTGLTALKWIYLEGMHSLKEFPALTGLTALEWIQLEGMHSLKELPALTGLTALEWIHLEGMHSLKELPALTALEWIHLEGMHRLKELPALTGLTALQRIFLKGMHSLKELPAFTGLTSLKGLWLEGMDSLKELPALTGLNAFKILVLPEMHNLKKELCALTELTELRYIELQKMHQWEKFLCEPHDPWVRDFNGVELERIHRLKELVALTGLTNPVVVTRLTDVYGRVVEITRTTLREMFPSVLRHPLFFVGENESKNVVGWRECIA